MARLLLCINQFSDGMMSVMENLLSSVSNMTIKMSRLRSKVYSSLLKLSLTTEDTIAKDASSQYKMNLFSLNTSLEVGISASATSGRKVKKSTKVTIP